MKTRKFLALVLAIAIGIVPLIFAGCADKTGGGTGDDGSIDENAKLPLSFGGEQWNLDGMTFNVLTVQDRTKTQAFNIVDLVAEDNLGDVSIITAVSERNERLKAVFNFEIKRITSNDMPGDASKAISQRDNSYQAFMHKVSGGLTLAAGGALVDFYNDVSYIDLERDYWDSTIVENLLLCGGAYIATGDINTVDDDSCWCVLFNKKLYEEQTHNLSQDLYDIVKSGDGKVGGWTTEYMKGVASSNYRKDPNVANKWEADYAGTGTYGIITQDEVATVLMQSSGNTPTKLAVNSLYGVTDNITGNTDFMDAFEAVYDFMGGSEKDEWNLNMNTVPTSAASDIWETIARGGFKANRSMFFICHVGTINLIRDMDEEFGVLPVPKLVDTQEEYGNTIQYVNANCYVVPSFTDYDKDADETAAYILEAMCYYSSSDFFEAMGSEDTSLKHAYRETVLKRKATRDDESMEMLDLVFNNRIFDLACALNLSNVNNVIMNTATSRSAPQFTSSISSMVSMESSLAKLLEPLTKIR